MIHSATAIAEKYHVDLDHADNVAEVAVRLFDLFQADHGLGPRHRLLLRVAALLHEVGGFVSSRAHHKHSEYLIANSEIFGLNRNEITLVSQIARYHRRSVPRSSHPTYMALPRESRVVVNKLAALLRVADALIRGHRRRASDIQFQRQGDELIVSLPQRPRPAAGRTGDRDQGRSVRGHLRREDPAGTGVSGKSCMSKTPKKSEPRDLAKPSSSQTPSHGDFDVVLGLIEAARTRAVAAVNTTLIDLYWSVGEYHQPKDRR